ncbi:MAG: TRAP transporter small permease subunit [Actinobacteria bacterium]|nr:TRAP transporter small permease subunit [Actinomycetota bacterium]
MDRVSNAVGTVSKYLVLLVVAVGFFNALLRYAGRFAGRQLTSNRYVELQWYLYAGVFLLAFAYILQHGINVRVDFWFADRSRRTKAAIDFVGHLVGLLPFTILGIWLTWNPVVRSFGARPDNTLPTWRVWEIWERSPDPGGLPRAPIKLLLLLGLVLLLLQALAEMVKLASELTGHGRHVERAQENGPLRVE